MEHAQTSQPLITQFRDGHRFMRVTASIILCCFTVVFYSPAVNATLQAVDDYLAYKPDYPVFAEMGTALASTQQLVNQLGAVTATPAAITALQQQLNEQRDNFIELDDGANDYFDDQLRYYQQQKMPQKTITALQQKQKSYQAAMVTLQHRLQQISTLKKAASLAQEVALTKTLLQKLYNPIHHPYDQTMPFGPLSNTVGAPAQTAEDLEALLGPEGTTYVSGPEATASPAIIALAQSLDYDRVKVYNWVRNNIEFIPSYGSLQGADYTLQTRRGNAFDQASLLIALLRAIGHGTRYVYGSIQITNQEAMNWVGGVREPEAAQNLLSQGGIPVARLSVNGDNDFIMLDHVWVSVRIGTKWVELDPSFKQYRYTEGMDLQSQVSFDAQAFATTLQSTATVNETEGWVQNVNQAFIETELDDYRQALEDYLTTQQPDATVGDVIGSKTIIQRTAGYLPSSLPYTQVFVSQEVSDIPEDLQYKFTFQLQDSFGGELLNHTATTVELAGKPLAISFNPATAADEQALLDYLPDNPQSADDLPNIIPAGLMNVVGELTINGQVAASSAAMSFGQVLQTEKGYFVPGRGWSTTINPIITGEYQAIGLDYHGISPQQLQALQARLEATKVSLEAEEFTGLTKHDVVGDLMQSGVMSYLAITDVQAKLAAQSSDIVYYREPSYGTFQTNAKTNGLLNTIANVEMTGLLMDMDSMKFSTECKSNCWENWRDFNQQLGSTYSAYEHLVPEQLFSTVDEPVEGISAVKALAIASQQGQRIYTFTEDNLQYLSDLTVDQGTIDEIRTQVQNGMVATVHQHPISYAGFIGSGYIIIDPETGAGGYKISGGSDGMAMVLAVLSSLLIVLSIVAVVAQIFATLVLGAPMLTGIAVALTVLSIVSYGVGIFSSYAGGCNADDRGTLATYGGAFLVVAAAFSLMFPASLFILAAFGSFGLVFGYLSNNVVKEC